MKRSAILLMLLALTGCANERKDYDAEAKCQAMGLTPGTEAYVRCLTDYKNEQLLQQQRRELEQMKREREDIRMRGEYLF